MVDSFVDNQPIYSVFDGKRLDVGAASGYNRYG